MFASWTTCKLSLNASGKWVWCWKGILSWLNADTCFSSHFFLCCRWKLEIFWPGTLWPAFPLWDSKGKSLFCTHFLNQYSRTIINPTGSVWRLYLHAFSRLQLCWSRHSQTSCQRASVKPTRGYSKFIQQKIDFKQTLRTATDWVEPSRESVGHILMKSCSF